MRRISNLVTLFGLTVLVPMSFLQGGEFKLEPGFTLLFNGKNFDGWQPKGKKDPLMNKTEVGRFKVVDGMAHFDSAKKGDSYIETVKQFAGDVHVKFDFKPGPKCNNDFFIRGIKFDIVPGNKENKTIKEGEWYTCEIIAKGDTVEHKINGEVVRTTKSKAKSAPFIMRAEIGVIDVKNIRAKE